MGHGAGEGDALGGVHALEVDRHGEGRDLGLAEAALRDALHDQLYFVVGQGVAVALLADEFLGKHQSLAVFFR